MAQYAPVVPVHLARGLLARGLLGYYHLLLAHDVIKHPKEYEEVYKDPKNFIIMDNSVIELGHAVDKTTLQEACSIVDANVLVLPDVLMDGAQTYSKSVMAFSSWQDTIDFNKVRPMIIPQGQTLYEWINCAERFAAHELGVLAYVGIARNIREKLHLSRAIAAGWAVHLFEQELHMFGFSNDLKDDLYTCAAFPEIMGIDSAVPVRMGCYGQPMSLDQDDPGPRGDWWDSLPTTGLGSVQWDVIADNMAFVREEIDLDD